MAETSTASCKVSQKACQSTNISSCKLAGLKPPLQCLSYFGGTGACAKGGVGRVNPYLVSTLPTALLLTTSKKDPAYFFCFQCERMSKPCSSTGEVSAMMSLTYSSPC